MHFVDFALVPQESAAVREALELLAALDEALIRPIVLVHVFTTMPLAMGIQQIHRYTNLHSHLRSKVMLTHSRYLQIILLS